MDGMPLEPLWRPPLELLFVELHEEQPIRHSVSDLGATIRMERFVPYFLDKFKARPDYAGKAGTYVLFPDKGAFDRYLTAVTDRLKLSADHILYIKKTRVGEKIGQEQKLFYELPDGKLGEKESFVATDHVLIIDDFTNSGSTLFGAVDLVRKLSTGESPAVSIFVSHLVAAYDTKVVQKLQEKLHSMGPTCRFFTTNSIPLTTDMLKSDPQVKVFDISDFVADLVQV
jgi:phosphoribosylpyrophosphate synthetase